MLFDLVILGLPALTVARQCRLASGTSRNLVFGIPIPFVHLSGVIRWSASPTPNISPCARTREVCIILLRAGAAIPLRLVLWVLAILVDLA